MVGCNPGVIVIEIICLYWTGLKACALCMYVCMHVSDLDPISTPQIFYTYFYNHAHRLRLEKLLLYI
jgi:hypothetical protein